VRAGVDGEPASPEVRVLVRLAAAVHRRTGHVVLEEQGHPLGAGAGGEDRRELGAQLVVAVVVVGRPATGPALEEVGTADGAAPALPELRLGGHQEHGAVCRPVVLVAHVGGREVVGPGAPGALGGDP
jgi:hypothetical protein